MRVAAWLGSGAGRPDGDLEGRPAPFSSLCRPQRQGHCHPPASARAMVGTRRSLTCSGVLLSRSGSSAQPLERNKDAPDALVYAVLVRAGCTVVAGTPTMPARRAGPNLRDARNATILRSTRGVVRVRLWCGLEVRSLPLVRGLPEHAHALSCDLPVAAHASRHIVPRARYSVAAVLDGSHDGGGFEVLN